MTVLEVCDYHGPYPGNFVPTLLAVGAAVRDRLGRDYRCAFPRAMRDRPWVAQLEDAGIPLHWLDEDAPRAQRLRQLNAIADGAGLLRSHFTNWDLEALAVARRRRVPVVWNIHTSSPGRRRSDLVKARALGRLCDRVIAVSEAVVAESLERGFPADKVTLVRNGIDLARFGPDAPARVAHPDSVVLAFGWEPHWKGVDVLVRALSDPPPGVVARIVGGDVLRAALPDPLPPWLRIVAPVQDPRELYAAADVFVSASRREAFSYAIGEAMMMRLPVVSSDLPGPAAYFAAEGVRTYPVEDAGALRTAILAALADPAGGEANRAYVTEHLPLSRHVDGVIAVFEALL